MSSQYDFWLSMSVAKMYFSNQVNKFIFLLEPNIINERLSYAYQ